MNINVQAPLNPLSFGQVSYNILRDLKKRTDVEVFYHPIGNVDLSAYQVDEDFQIWLQKCVNRRFDALDAPSLRIWHLNGSESRLGRGKGHLLTFHETSNVTPQEKSIAEVYDKIFTTSTYTNDNFKNANCQTPFEYVPLGFDEDFHVLKNPKKLTGKVHWGLCGKWEKRKHSAKILSLWAERYGNNGGHHLTCVVSNPFVQQEELKAEILAALQGKSYFNIQFLNPMPLNSQMNEFYNSIDIDLSGLSGAEGLGLAAFTKTALGGTSVVLNATAHKDWATNENCVLVEPNGTEELIDNRFFVRGQNFNQGNFYTFDNEMVAAAMNKAHFSCQKIKEENFVLQDSHSYKTGVDKILDSIE